MPPASVAGRSVSQLAPVPVGRGTRRAAALVAGVVEVGWADRLMPWVLVVTEPECVPVRFMRTEYQEEAERFAERIRESARRKQRDRLVVTVKWEKPDADPGPSSAQPA